MMRITRMHCLLVVSAVWLGMACNANAQNAVQFRGVTYVSIQKLLHRDFLDGRWELSNSGRTLDVYIGERHLAFSEGGDRVAIGSEAPQPLENPLLVLSGNHFAPIDECASLFGYTHSSGTDANLVYKDRRLVIDAEPLSPKYLKVQARELKATRRVVRLTRGVKASPHLQEGIAPEDLPPGTVLLVRRIVSLNGKPHLIATRADASLTTYAIAADMMEQSSEPSSLDGTPLGGLFATLDARAGEEAGIDHGSRNALPKQIAVTVDLCWSLKPFERDFFRFVPRYASQTGEAHITLFMTGRWLQQHPSEMESLIELSREGSVGVTWALHSWSHPKEQPFMNSFSPDELQADALKLEHDLLEWGIVPSIFYRFPGLIHDEERLRAIRDIDLLSIDCDSWVASMRLNRPPHRTVATDGSILLIHGNGNEPVGIPRLYEWMIANPGYRFVSLPHVLTAGPSTQPAQ